MTSDEAATLAKDMRDLFRDMTGAQQRLLADEFVSYEYLIVQQEIDRHAKTYTALNIPALRSALQYSRSNTILADPAVVRRREDERNLKSTFAKVDDEFDRAKANLTPEQLEQLKQQVIETHEEAVRPLLRRLDPARSRTLKRGVLNLIRRGRGR